MINVDGHEQTKSKVGYNKVTGGRINDNAATI